MERKALGKGLQALLPGKESSSSRSVNTVQEIPLEHIIPNRYQPRERFSERELAELASSLKESGFLQPVLVRMIGDGNYELIAGERRLRAAKLAEFATIPALVKNSSDEQSMILSLVENIQREELNPMEEARTYKRLMAEFGLTQEQVATQVGKDRSTVANITRLTSLPKSVQGLVETGKISLGHAKVILGVDGAPLQELMAEKIIGQGLSVRQTEDLAAGFTKKRQSASLRKKHAEPEMAGLEAQLRQALGTRVMITKGKRGGKIVLSYFSQDDLARITEMILS